MAHRRSVAGLACVLPGLMLAACAAAGDGPSAAPASVREDVVRYVALGDSYTIGTGIGASESWPAQLVAREPRLKIAANLGVNGYTSADLIADELPVLDTLDPEFATLMIGVNDVVQGVPDATYEANVALILDALLARLTPNRVLCVATPDYTVTPQGAAYGDPAQQSDRIGRVNAILGEACEGRGVTFVPEIFEISREAGDDRAMLAADGLHPSGAQYARWVGAIAPVVGSLLGD
ncbi:MAG: SGNH/GDSL hydrolase family protein [Candidatus Limnocylindria bacterium]